MRNEIISIETLEKISSLKKENKQLIRTLNDIRKFMIDNCITSNEWTEVSPLNFIPTGKINCKTLSKNKVKELLKMLGWNVYE